MLFRSSGCDYLIVGVHPPGSSHKNKPTFIPLEERMEIVRSIKQLIKIFRHDSAFLKFTPNIDLNQNSLNNPVFCRKSIDCLKELYAIAGLYHLRISTNVFYLVRL